MRKKTILIVEDDEGMLDIYKSILGETYYLLLAMDVASARKLLISGNVDLMILDIILPKIKGNVLFDELLRAPQYKDLRILVVSVVKDFGSFVTQKDPSGRTQFIAKPFEKKALLETIEKMIRKDV